MGEAPERSACGCGQQAERVIGAGVHSIVRGAKKLLVDSFSMPPGWQNGNTDCEAYEKKVFETVRAKKRKGREERKQGIANGCQFIGHVPQALVNMRARQFGGDHFSFDIEKKLRDEGLHVDQS